MKVKRVISLFWSATGMTEKVTNTIAAGAAQVLNKPLETINITLPEAREHALVFEEGDLVVVGSPTYAGKLPNKMLSCRTRCFSCVV